MLASKIFHYALEGVGHAVSAFPQWEQSDAERTTEEP